ncbi:MAG: AraC family transcriptional regulator [Clostridia bacterium]|nr:AraC family transcriptional regulator [Clostridia bacterium]
MRISDISPPNFENGGRFTSQGDWCHGKRIIESYELILVTRGTVYLEEDGIRHTLEAGDYIILHPRRPHGGWRVSKEEIQFYWLHFQSEEDFPLPFVGTAGSSEILVQNARQLLQMQQSPVHPPAAADHMMYVLLSELLVQRQQKKPQNALAIQTLEYIRAHSDELLTPTGVAEALGYHPDHLSRVLKAYSGATLSAQIIQHRLSRACWLLQTTEYTVARIAMELGYADPNLFDKFFTYHMDMPPKAYRNSFTKTHTNHK